MTELAALLVLAIGICIGYQLPAPFARWGAFWRRRTFKPAIMRPYDPNRTDERGN
jgi:hypothetical protein